MTRARRLVLFATALAAAPTSNAAGVDWFGGGVGYGDSRYSRPGTAYLLRWQRDMQPWRSLDRYVELAAGAWTGRTDNNVVSASLGARYGLGHDVRLYGSWGIGYVSEHTKNLGTRGQFAWCLGAARRVGNYDISVSQIHYSNGREAFGTRGPNVGDNFLMLTVMHSLD
jgi:hypothetical protein